MLPCMTCNYYIPKEFPGEDLPRGFCEHPYFMEKQLYCECQKKGYKPPKMAKSERKGLTGALNFIPNMERCPKEPIVRKAMKRK